MTVYIACNVLKISTWEKKKKEKSDEISYKAIMHRNITFNFHRKF